MRYSNRVFTAIIACAALLAGCSNQTRNEDEAEDFTEFYERFHTDSAFQMSRIAFPLSGIPVEDSADNFTWNAEDWKIHRPFDNRSKEFERKINVVTEDLIVETISVRGLNIAMQRRFGRLADGWNLIYYVEMQPME